MNVHLKRSLPFINNTDTENVFESPWQGQLFAITIHLSEQGNFSWSEFVAAFGKILKKRKDFKKFSPSNEYYSCWLQALEEIIVKKNLGSTKNLSSLKGKWEKAFLITPHGSPVKI